jgi:hypothetical protein
MSTMAKVVQLPAFNFLLQAQMSYHPDLEQRVLSDGLANIIVLGDVTDLRCFSRSALRTGTISFETSLRFILRGQPPGAFRSVM